jgi:hypothetical protein
MFIYQPTINATDRVVWYGGESTQLHYEQQVDGRNDNSEWIGCAVRTLGGGIPQGVSELHAELVDFYNYCQVATLD